MYRCNHILLVEDDEDDQAFFLDAIRKIHPGVEVTMATNGQEALTLLETVAELPQLIFLDINMPLVNGLECLALIKKDARLRLIPIFILSTSGDPVSVSIAKRLEADGYLTKPYEREVLTVHLEQVLRMDLSQPRAEREQPFLQLLTHDV